MKKKWASLITIGDELLIGQTLDTNSAWMARQLNDIGVWVRRRVAIGDDREAILQALAEESREADVILITGGLGPTNDDITKEVLCEYFGSALVEDPVVLEQVKARFAGRHIPMPKANLKQALVPDNCLVLPNSRGTAPGMWFERDGRIYVSMPGVPHEMQGIMTSEVLPRLARDNGMPVILHRTLVTMGMGESLVAEKLSSLESSLPPGIKLAYLPGDGLLRLRLTALGDERQRMAAEMDQYFGVLRDTLPDITVAEEDISLEEQLGRLLKERGQTLATAESCTGGYISHRITSIPGSSAYFAGGVVSYDALVKIGVLGVAPETIHQHGEVSEPTVRAMARGALDNLNTTWAVAVSGIMGPGGGTPDKPVGTVWIAVLGQNGLHSARKHQLRYDRMTNIRITANYAMKMVCDAIRHGDTGVRAD